MSVAKHHVEWLSLVEHSGPFLSLKVLMDAFSEGLETDDSDTRAAIRSAYEEWSEAHEEGPAPAIHTAWVQFVLREVLEFDDDVLREGPAIPDGLALDGIRPDLVVVNPSGREPANKARFVVRIHPAGTSLEKPSDKDVLSTPTSELRVLLHHAGVPLGVATNGEEWRVVSARPGEPTGVASFYASLWLDEPLTLRAFHSLFGMSRFFAVADDETVERLYARSAEDTEEVTNQLGAQVRRSVEILVQDIDRIDADRGRALLTDVSEQALYEAAVTVMMRLVFLLSAEERGLLRLGQLEYDAAYAVSTLREQLREVADKSGEEILERRFDAWSRLLATFRAVYGGVQHEALKLPAYKGSLFDPDRFAFLEGRLGPEDTPDPLPIHNRTVLHLLESVQLLEVKIGRGLAPERRKLSFKSLSVEQIGYVYEGLLDHTAKRKDEPVLGLQGGKGKEPEVAVSELVEKLSEGPEAFAKHYKKLLGRSEKSILKALDAAFEDADPMRLERLRVVCGQDEDLVIIVRPFLGLLRDDVFGYPVVFRAGSVFVTEGTDRRTTGTHYTPPSITEPIVKHTLDPVLYEGPSEGKPEAEWALKSAKGILDLKVCDFAMGSGAFLVQAVRYLGDRLVEAWTAAEREADGETLLVTPDGAVSEGHPHERPLPQDPDERVVLARRAVASRCIYGVDKNPMAVELAKLSLWLETLEKNKPFTFLDHALKPGDTLFGLTDAEQIRRFHWFPSEAAEISDQGDFFQGLFGLEKVLDEALRLRLRIESFAVEEERDADAKIQDLETVELALSELRTIADILASAARESAGGAATSLAGAISVLVPQVAEALKYLRGSIPRQRAFERLQRRASDVLNSLMSKPGEACVFHWPLEFPEVFVGGGFDAVVGNPPFLGNRLWKERIGEHLRELVEFLLGGPPGKIDLCVAFHRRAGSLIREGGLYGLLGTTNISDGSYVSSGLGALVRDGKIVFAQKAMRWPGSASVTTAVVCYQRGSGWSGPCTLDGQRVKKIGPRLLPATQSRENSESSRMKPARLSSSPWAFEGVHNGRGQAFLLRETDSWFRKLATHAEELLVPYVTGNDITSHSLRNVSRWALDIQGRTLEEIGDISPSALRFLEEVVQPTRGEADLRSYRGLYQRWWQFWNTREKQYARLRRNARCVLFSKVTSYPICMVGRSDWLYTNQVVVVGFERPDLYAICLSAPFTAWIARFCGGPLGVAHTLRLSLREGFQTFPLPDSSAGTARDYASEFGSVVSDYCEGQRAGLTKLMHDFHNPAVSGAEIDRLRSLMQQISDGVCDAYGWSDLKADFDFVETVSDTVGCGFRFQVPADLLETYLDRLVELNHRRSASEDAADGTTKSRRKKSSRTRKKSAPRARHRPNAALGSLFEEDDS